MHSLLVCVMLTLCLQVPLLDDQSCEQGATDICRDQLLRQTRHQGLQHLESLKASQGKTSNDAAVRYVMAQFSDVELDAIARVIAPAIPRLLGRSLKSSFARGFNSARETKVQEVAHSQESLAARTMLHNWSTARGLRNLNRSEMSGLHSLLTVILGEVRPPGGLRKGLSNIGLLSDDGQVLYQARLKLLKHLQVKRQSRGLDY